MTARIRTLWHARHGYPCTSGQPGEGAFLHGAHGTVDEGAKHRPHVKEQVLVEVTRQVVAQALVQDGAVQGP